MYVVFDLERGTVIELNIFEVVKPSSIYAAQSVSSLSIHSALQIRYPLHGGSLGIQLIVTLSESVRRNGTSAWSIASISSAANMP